MKGVSILISAYKSQNFIEECLYSIESQTYFNRNNNYEVLIGVDNCQETLNRILKIKNRYRNLRVFMMKENYGTYVVTNTLLDLCKFNDVIRFDSDDIMFPTMVETIMYQKEQADVVRFGFFNFHDNIIFQTNIDRTLQIAVGVIYFKKNVIRQYGGYRPWMCGADSEMLKRLNKNIKGLALLVPLFYRRVHNNSLSHNDETGMHTEYRKTLKDRVSKINEDDPFIKITKGKYECIV